MTFGSIVDARRGLTIPEAAVVVAEPLQGPTPCASSVSDPVVAIVRFLWPWLLA